MANQATTLACLCGLLLLPAFGPASSSGSLVRTSDAKDLSPHIGDLESAQKEALERNVPLLIHIILDDEEHSDRYRDAVLPNKELIELSSNCVVIVGNNGDHRQATITEKVNGKKSKRDVCSVYRMFDHCAPHRDTFDELYLEYKDEGGDLVCPQTVILTPTGEIAWRDKKPDAPSAKAVAKVVKDAQKKAGASLTPDGLRVVKSQHIAAASLAQKKNWPAVWTRNQAILELIDVGMWAEGARAAQKDALKKMSDRLASLEESFVPGQVGAAWREFSLFAAATRETPLTREVALLKRKIERNKELKEELAAIKIELAAEELEAEAEALLQKDEERKAMKVLKKILGKKYAGTETAKRVRERFPDLG